MYTLFKIQSTLYTPIPSCLTFVCEVHIFTEYMKSYLPQQKMVKQKELEIRRMTLELHSEKNLREDLEMEVCVKSDALKSKGKYHYKCGFCHSSFSYH